MIPRTARAALLCAGLVLGFAPARAQQPPDTSAAGRRGGAMPMMGMAGGDCPMMAATMRGPAAALHARDALHLSAAQVQRLEGAQRRVDEAQARVMDSMRVLHPRLAALADARTFDERAARAAFERMGRLHADVGVAMLRAQHDAADVLTAPQRDSLAALGRAQMGTMPPGGGPAGAACPGMMGMPMSPMPHHPGAGHRP